MSVFNENIRSPKNKNLVVIGILEAKGVNMIGYVALDLHMIQSMLSLALFLFSRVY
jgi:hypothetical protein